MTCTGFIWGSIGYSELSVRERRRIYWLSNYQDLLFHGVSYLIWSVKCAGFFFVLITIYVTASRKINTPALLWRQYPGNSRVSIKTERGSHAFWNSLFGSLIHIFCRCVDCRLIYLHYFRIIPSPTSQIKESILNYSLHWKVSLFIRESDGRRLAVEHTKS
jgi:hypothetical protein